MIMDGRAGSEVQGQGDWQKKRAVCGFPVIVMLTWDISVCVCPCLTAGLSCPGAMTYASSVSCRTCTGAWIIFRSFFAGEKMSDPVRMDIKWSSACQSCSAKSFRLCQVARVLRAVQVNSSLLSGRLMSCPCTRYSGSTRVWFFRRFFCRICVYTALSLVFVAFSIIK